jgi:hypothetical protein
MKTPMILKRLLKSLPLVIVMAVAVGGLWMAKDINPGSIDTQYKTNTQLPVEQLELLNVSATMSKCFSLLVYTSYPAKCRTSDGSFIQMNEFSSNIVVTPNVK